MSKIDGSANSALNRSCSRWTICWKFPSHHHFGSANPKILSCRASGTIQHRKGITSIVCQLIVLAQARKIFCIADLICCRLQTCEKQGFGPSSVIGQQMTSAPDLPLLSRPFPSVVARTIAVQECIILIGKPFPAYLKSLCI